MPRPRRDVDAEQRAAEREFKRWQEQTKLTGLIAPRPTKAQLRKLQAVMGTSVQTTEELDELMASTSSGDESPGSDGRSDSTVDAEGPPSRS